MNEANMNAPQMAVSSSFPNMLSWPQRLCEMRLGHHLLSCLVCFFWMSCSSNAKELPKDSLENQIELYLDYAFASSDKLKKFPFAPKISLVCKDRKPCDLLKESLVPALPEKSSLVLLDVYAGNFSIFLLTDKTTFDVVLKNDNATNSWQTQKWGDEKCSVIQIVDQFSIVKLIIYANPDEGLDLNSVCFLTELLKGSGGGLQTNYEKFASNFASTHFDELKKFKALTLVALHYHWSTLLRPGMNRSEAEINLRSFLKLTPKN